jgi:UrcA family protein
MTRSAASPIAASAILAAWFGLASFACAAELPAQPSAAHVVTVRAGDLDLNTKVGAEALIGRIADASTRACWPDELSNFAEYSACRDGMVLQAVKTMNKPLVSLAYAETYHPATKPLIVASAD